MTAAETQIDIRSFHGPFDLLYELIEKNRMDIYDIPITEITDQYLDAIRELETLDMDLASEFLVMAATLLQIKSRSLLPQIKSEVLAVEDPRDELVIKLLRYRRCRVLAVQLKDAHEVYSDTVIRLPETATSMGITQEYVEDNLSYDRFLAAVQSVDCRNRSKYHDLRKSLRYLLRRERVSIKDKVKEILRQVWKRQKILFHEIFPPQSSSKLEQVTGFLALLELMRQNRVTVNQTVPYGQMLIEKGSRLSEEDVIRGVEVEDIEEST
ncbi:MAG TPA: segregation/condensation protein A [Clostridiaceae bacterium]|nr:segregation/condensation protein A [Clostridiaceae bacterium]